MIRHQPAHALSPHLLLSIFPNVSGAAKKLASSLAATKIKNPPWGREATDWSSMVLAGRGGPIMPNQAATPCLALRWLGGSGCGQEGDICSEGLIWSGG